MEHREELVADALAMDTELGSIFDDLDSAEDTLLGVEVLDLPDLELLLPSGDLGDDLLNSLLPNEENEKNSVVAMELEEETQGLTVSVDGTLTLASEEQETELAMREIKFLEAQRDFLQFKAKAAASGLKCAEEEIEYEREMKEEERLEVSRRCLGGSGTC